MTVYVFGHAVVTNAVAVNLRELSRRLDKAHCGGMFVVGLSPTGAAPATRFISSGWIPQVYAQTIASNTLLYTRAKAAWEADGDVFPFTQAQVTNALSNCTITNGRFNGQPETWQALIARLGLQVVRTAI